MDIISYLEQKKALEQGLEQAKAALATRKKEIEAQYQSDMAEVREQLKQLGVGGRGRPAGSKNKVEPPIAVAVAKKGKK